MTNPTIKEFDYTDIQIISILDKEHKISTEKISELLDIPARSIRYRLQRLREKGIFQKKIIITHERKLGMRESFFFIQENPKYLSQLFEILDVNPAIWYVPSTGKFSGFYVHTLDIIDLQNQSLNLIKELKKINIIIDYFYSEVIDFVNLEWNFSYFDKEGNWSWTWNFWKEMIQKRIGNNKIKTRKFEETHDKIKFDFLDIQILTNLYTDEIVPLKKIADKLTLSESQISRRIKTMEENGIIKGYRSGFYPFKELMTLDCIIEANTSMDIILDLLKAIPYPCAFVYGKKNQIICEIDLPNDELLDFVNAFYELRPLVDLQFIQIWHKHPQLDPIILYEFFNEEINSWNFNKYYEKSLKKLESIKLD
ncbi:MAG TPA: winged helix-turn-helix transcriptional regulator [Candidatus Bathyarchaeia archaeon]|nr:winged helix-turn-helix transcriptional regulator [Candidatus Bathyarchaeia archaeon]